MMFDQERDGWAYPQATLPCPSASPGIAIHPLSETRKGKMGDEP